MNKEVEEILKPIAMYCKKYQLPTQEVYMKDIADGDDEEKESDECDDEEASPKEKEQDEHQKNGQKNDHEK